MAYQFDVEIKHDEFIQILVGSKHHDLRKNNDYNIGEYICYWEVDNEGYRTGRFQLVRITYITSVKSPCAYSSAALNPEYCIISFERPF